MKVLTADLQNGVLKFDSFAEAYDYHDGGARHQVTLPDFYSALNSPACFSSVDWLYVEFDSIDDEMAEIIEKIENEYGIK